MNKIPLFAFALLVATVLAQAPKPQIDYENFNIPDVDQFLLTDKGNLKQATLGMVDNGVIYFHFIGYDHTKKIYISAVELGANEKAPLFEIPSLELTSLQNPTSSTNFDITAKRLIKGNATPEDLDDTSNTYCTQGKFKAIFNTVIIKCAHTSFVNTDIKSGSNDWETLIAGNKKWVIVNDDALSTSLTYITSIELPAATDIGADVSNFNSPSFFSADTNTFTSLISFLTKDVESI